MKYNVISFLNYVSQMANIQVVLLEATASNSESDLDDIFSMKTTIYNKTVDVNILHVVKFNGIYFYYRKV